jgi:predicted phosphodiesterase
MFIQYVSDLHLEFESERKTFESLVSPVKNSKECFTILILAGDICTTTCLDVLRRFLSYCAQNWSEVIYIPGNHEYYYVSVEKGNQILRGLCEELNITFGPKLRFTFPIHTKTCKTNVHIIATTLWSYIDPSKESDVVKSINDYQYIVGFGVKTSNALHSEAREFLASSIKEFKNDDPNCMIVVVSHHAPLLKGTSSSRYENATTNAAFCSDCSDLMINVGAWIFGHTHYNMKPFKHGNTLITSNQRGYNRGNGETLKHYDPTKFLSL